jgi:hypothetical protein
MIPASKVRIHTESKPARRQALRRTVPADAALLAALVLHVVVPAEAVSQEAVRVASAPVCSSCRIVVDTIAVLGDIDGPGTVGGQAHIRRTGGGAYLVYSPQDPGAIKVFDRNGSYRTTIGRRGEGPGEYHLPWIAPTAGDAIDIVDLSLLRLTTLSPEFEVVGTNRLPLTALGAVRLDKDRIVITGIAPTREGAGLPLHLFDSEAGTILRSFGAMGTMERVVGRGDWSQVRRVAPGGDGTVWSAHVSRYRVERWDTAGRMLAAYERDANWFVPWESGRQEGNILTHPPRPEFVDIAEDEAGRLWTLSARAAQNWQPPVPIMRGTHPYLSDAAMNGLYDSVVEVLAGEGAERRVHAARTFRGRMPGFVAPGVVYLYDEDAVGNPRYLILRLRLHL